MQVTVNISNDFTAGALFHNVLLPPLIPVPAPMFSVEMIAFQFWPPGYALGQNKLTTTVKHKGMSIVQDGHDQGAMILDITPPQPANLYYAIMWPFSGRKITFGAAKVKMDGQGAGCSQAFLIPLPMMTCGDPVSAPTAIPIPTQKLNSVIVGMTLTDLLAGLANIVISMAIDFVFHAVGKKGPNKFKQAVSDFGKRAFSREVMEQVAGTAATTTARILMQEALGKFVPTSGSSAFKFALSGLAGFTSSSIQGNPTYSHSLGPGFLQVGVSTDKGAQANVFGWNPL